MSNTTTIQKQLQQLWATTQSNAGILPTKLAEVQKNIEKFEAKLIAPLNVVFAHIDIAKKASAFKDTALQRTASINAISIDFKGIYTAIKALDNEDLYTYLYLYQELSEVLKNILAEIVTIEKESVVNILDELEIALTNGIDILELSYGYDDYTTLELIENIRLKIEAFIQQLGKYNISNAQIDNIRLAVKPIFNSIAMVFVNKNKEGNTQEALLDLENQYQNGFIDTQTTPQTPNINSRADNATTNLHIVDQINTHFSQIANEIRTIPIVNKIPFQEKDLKDLWDFSLDFVKDFDTDDFYEVETAIYTLQEKAEYLFEFLTQKMDKNLEALQLITNFIQPLVKQWLTLPNDFRPNNWVEVMHFIVKNIQNSFNAFAHGANAGFMPQVQGFISKLEAILSTIDNEDFKLIIAPKEKAYIHEIQLPNLLEPEEEAVKVKGQTPILQSNTANTADSTATTANETDSETANETEKTEEDKPLTISTIIDYLCFDREYGAFNKLSEEQYVVIYDLYYKQWFSNRLDTIIDDAQELFSKETLTAIWEELKVMLLNEKGVNLGQLIDFIIDKGTELLNKLLTFVKETLTYIIDELFLLVKAIIAFFQKVDLPPAARELLKKLPPFANMPDEVTLLHILAALPYTLWQEFVNFEVKTQTV